MSKAKYALPAGYKKADVSYFNGSDRLYMKDSTVWTQDGLTLLNGTPVDKALGVLPSTPNPLPTNAEGGEQPAATMTDAELQAKLAADVATGEAAIDAAKIAAATEALMLDTGMTGGRLDGHASDCAVHNEPAEANGPCTCGFADQEASDAAAAIGQAELDTFNKAKAKKAAMGNEEGAPENKPRVAEGLMTATRMVGKYPERMEDMPTIDDINNTNAQ